MDVVATSSRGFGPTEEFNLEALLPAGTRVYAEGGGKLKSLTQTAISMTPPPYRQKRRTHIYFICCIPDITELIKSENPKTYKYRETIFIENPDLAIDRVNSLLRESQRDVLRHGALPIYATTPLANLEIYNNYCLSPPPYRKKKTSILYHSAHYEEMQNNLDQVIISINKTISNLNKSVGAATPFLHDTLKESRGRKKKRYFIYKWDRLRDGLHAGESLMLKWAEVLNNCFRLNDAREEVEEVEDRSHKRSRTF